MFVFICRDTRAPFQEPNTLRLRTSQQKIPPAIFKRAALFVFLLVNCQTSRMNRLEQLYPRLTPEQDNALCVSINNDGGALSLVDTRGHRNTLNCCVIAVYQTEQHGAVAVYDFDLLLDKERELYGYSYYGAVAQLFQQHYLTCAEDKQPRGAIIVRSESKSSFPQIPLVDHAFSINGELYALVVSSCPLHFCGGVLDLTTNRFVKFS